MKKVKIIKCSNIDWWYEKKIGIEIFVKDYDLNIDGVLTLKDHHIYYATLDQYINGKKINEDDFIILKTDCIDIAELRKMKLDRII